MPNEIKWMRRGGVGIEQHGKEKKLHFSIHPFGRRKHKNKADAIEFLKGQVSAALG